MNKKINSQIKKPHLKMIPFKRLAQLGFEFVYYHVAVQHVSHYTTETHLCYDGEKGISIRSTEVDVPEIINKYRD